MPNADQDAPPAPIIPPWLEPVTLGAMQQAVNRALAWSRTAEAAEEAAREVARAHLPAATMAMLAEAVAAVVADPEGLTFRRDLAAPAATQAEVVEALCYALRFAEDGKKNSGDNDFIAPMAAARLARHLSLSGFVVTRPPRAPIGPSPFGASNPGRPGAPP